MNAQRHFVKLGQLEIFSLEIFNFQRNSKPHSSNVMHGSKRPFTEKTEDMRRSYKNTQRFKGKVFYSVYGAIRFPYKVL